MLFEKIVNQVYEIFINGEPDCVKENRENIILDKKEIMSYQKTVDEVHKALIRTSIRCTNKGCEYMVPNIKEIAKEVSIVLTGSSYSPEEYKDPFKEEEIIIDDAKKDDVTKSVVHTINKTKDIVDYENEVKNIPRFEKCDGVNKGINIKDMTRSIVDTINKTNDITNCRNDMMSILGFKRRNMTRSTTNKIDEFRRNSTEVENITRDKKVDISDDVFVSGSLVDTLLISACEGAANIDIIKTIMQNGLYNSKSYMKALDIISRGNNNELFEYMIKFMKK